MLKSPINMLKNPTVLNHTRQIGLPLMPPQVTVIIPVFNGAATIKRALDSVVSQTFTNYEIVVVDDGSTDQTAEIVEQSCIERLVLIRHAQNRGAAAARNTGIAASKGRWLAFLDSDDTWMPEKVARQVQKMQGAVSNVTACVTGYHLHKGDRKQTVSLALPPGAFRREILFGCTISPGSTLFVEQRVFNEIGLFDENLRRLEDWDWFLRFAERYDMMFISEPLVKVYYTPSKAPYTLDEMDPVLSAIREIGKKHLPRMQSEAEIAQFKSALYIERAAHMYRRGRPLRAVLYVIVAFVFYPYRNISFFRTLWHSVVSLWRG